MLVQEADLDVGDGGDGFAVGGGGFEAPMSDGFDGLAVEAGIEG
jgi:hypothetical protein